MRVEYCDVCGSDVTASPCVELHVSIIYTESRRSDRIHELASQINGQDDDIQPMIICSSCLETLFDIMKKGRGLAEKTHKAKKAAAHD